MAVTPTRLTGHRPESVAIEGVLADSLAAEPAERLARALAPVRDLGGHRGGPGSLPARARFLDAIGLPDLDAAAVAAHWRAQPGGRNTTVQLGVTADGPFTVDLVADGPHALVAGTTGAGKSELLQTLVTALALGDRPDQLNVVLVDYKGGRVLPLRPAPPLRRTGDRPRRPPGRPGPGLAQRRAQAA